MSNLIAQTIGQMISQQEIKDPRVSTLLSVTDVDVSRDLSHAKVGISGYLDVKELDRAVEALNHATGFIQARLGKAMQTRLTPRLSFHANLNIEEAFKLTKKIEELVREPNADGPGPRP